jgi:hypothetical protein
MNVSKASREIMTRLPMRMTGNSPAAISFSRVRTQIDNEAATDFFDSKMLDFIFVPANAAITAAQCDSPSLLRLDVLCAAGSGLSAVLGVGFPGEKQRSRGFQCHSSAMTNSG